MPVYLLNEHPLFPDPEGAEDGIVAIGGDLTPERLLAAYNAGIFPWYSKDEPIMWWSPDPRFILKPSSVRISKSMKKVLRGQEFKITYNQAFESVIQSCASTPRKDQEGTWITEEMSTAYKYLHQLGYAQSVEVWKETKLVGGLYGVVIGKCFFGESMFSHISNASKAGFVTLVKRLEEEEFDLIDCQIETAHLTSLGAEPISRKDFLLRLEKNRSNDPKGVWL